jgi:hypothetical protein
VDSVIQAGALKTFSAAMHRAFDDANAARKVLFGNVHKSRAGYALWYLRISRRRSWRDARSSFQQRDLT